MSQRQAASESAETLHPQSIVFKLGIRRTLGGHRKARDSERHRVVREYVSERGQGFVWLVVANDTVSLGGVENSRGQKKLQFKNGGKFAQLFETFL